MPNHTHDNINEHDTEHAPGLSGVAFIAIVEVCLLGLSLAVLALLLYPLIYWCIGVLTLTTPLMPFDPQRLKDIPPERHDAVDKARKAMAVSYILAFTGFLIVALDGGWAEANGAEEGRFATFMNVNMAASFSFVASLIIGCIVHRMASEPQEDKKVPADRVADMFSFSMTRKCLTNWYYQRPEGVKDVLWKTLGM